MVHLYTSTTVLSVICGVVLVLGDSWLVNSKPQQPKIPLTLLLNSCPISSESQDIGPCLSEILGGFIEAAKPSFKTGVKIGGRRRIIDPLRLKDIREKKDKKFKISASNLQVHGINTISVKGIVFNPDVVSISVHFDNLQVKGKLKMTYLFLTAEPDVTIDAHNLNVTLTSNWGVESQSNQKVDLTLTNSQVQLEMERIGISVSGLAGLGSFLEQVVSRNQEILKGYFIKNIEKDLSEKMNDDLNRVKILS